MALRDGGRGNGFCLRVRQSLGRVWGSDRELTAATQEGTGQDPSRGPPDAQRPAGALKELSSAGRPAKARETGQGGAAASVGECEEEPKPSRPLVGVWRAQLLWVQPQFLRESNTRRVAP